MSSPTDRDPDKAPRAEDPADATATPGEPTAAPAEPTSTDRSVTTGESAGETTGQHAAPRPYPPTAPPTASRTTTAPQGAPTQVSGPRGAEPQADPGPVAPADPGGTPTATPAPTAAPAAASGDATPAPTDPDARPTDQAVSPPTRATTRAEARKEDEAPTRPGVVRHLLGALLGLVLTPVALLLTGIGTARLADVVGTSTVRSDALGLTLLLVGVVLLAAVVVLGLWSPAVPLTGGVLWGLGLGITYLAAPWVMDDVVASLTGTGPVPAAVDQLTQPAMSGELLVTGTLLAAAGLVAGLARRAGRRWAEAVAATQPTRP